jgi:hypothetical protein
MKTVWRGLWPAASSIPIRGPGGGPRRGAWSWRAGLPALVALLAVTACELAETTIPDGADLIVVESILDAGKDVQYLLLHRTLQGRLVGGEEGARVRVRRGDGLDVVYTGAPTAACTNLDPAFAAGKDSVEVRASCYLSPAAEGRWVVPGESYELLIETQAGARLHGRATVPGHFEPLGLSPAAARPMGEVGRCVLPPDSALALHWSTASGALAYMTHMRVEGLPDALAGSGIPEVPEVVELYGVSISERDTSIVVPTQMGSMELGKYDREVMLALRNGFPTGARVRLTIAAMDRNFVSATRGDGFNPSGIVRVSCVTGYGVGVFGAMVPYALVVEVHRGGGAACLVGE